MENTDTKLSYLIINIPSTNEALANAFMGVFGNILVDINKDSNFTYYAVQDNDADEIITWLNENFSDEVWCVAETKANADGSDASVHILEKSTNYDSFISDLNEAEINNDEVIKSNEQLEREAGLKATEEELNDDFSGEISDEESGVPVNEDDEEYIQSVEEYMENDNIDGQLSIDDFTNENVEDIENDKDIEDIEDSDNIDNIEDIVEENEDDDSEVEESTHLNVSVPIINDNEQADTSTDDIANHINENLEDQTEASIENNHLDIPRDYSSDDIVNTTAAYTTNDIDVDNVLLNKAEQAETYINYLNGDVDLLNNSTNALYNKMLTLNKPYDPEPEVQQYLQLAYDMAEINQQNSVSKSNVLNITKSLENYKLYEKEQIENTKQLVHKLNALNNVFDAWLEDKPSRFSEFYDYLSREVTNSNRNLLKDIQILLNDNNIRIDEYSALLADDLDNINPDILQRQKFNGILAKSYESSKSLYNSMRNNILNTTAQEAKSLIDESLSESEARIAELEKKLADKENELSAYKNQPHNDMPVNEENIIENEDFNDNSVNESVEDFNYNSDENEELNNDNIIDNKEDTSADKNDVLDLTGGPEENDEDNEVHEDNQTILDDESNISENENDFTEDLNLDNDEYVDEKVGFFSKMKVWPIWKKALTGVLALALLGGVGFGVKKLVFPSKNQTEQSESANDPAYKQERAMAFIKDNFKVGDELLLNIDGKQANFTVADYPKDGKIGLILKDSDGKVIELDENTIATYINADDTLKAKKAAFYKKYDEKHKKITPEENKNPIQNENLSVDFGNAANNNENQSNLNDNNSNENAEDNKDEDNTSNNRPTINRDDIEIEILNKNN